MRSPGAEGGRAPHGLPAPGWGPAGCCQPPAPRVAPKTPKCGHLAARGGSEDRGFPGAGPCAHTEATAGAGGDLVAAPQRRTEQFGGFLPLCRATRPSWSGPYAANAALCSSPSSAGPSCTSLCFCHGLGWQNLGSYGRRAWLLHVPLVASWLVAWARTRKQEVARGSSWAVREVGVEKNEGLLPPSQQPQQPHERVHPVTRQLTGIALAGELMAVIRAAELIWKLPAAPASDYFTAGGEPTKGARSPLHLLHCPETFAASAPSSPPSPSAASESAAGVGGDFTGADGK